jgi:ubiquinone/menaquinone biosynthesis C-methylase UbiE
MLNNLVNVYDCVFLVKKCIKAPSMILSKLVQGKQTRTEKAWEHTSSPPINWWDIPAVRKRWNYMVSGDPDVEHYEYISGKYLKDRNGLSALSVGCGTGHRELRWAETGQFKCIDAYDLSEQRIRYAVDAADKKGLRDIIHYRTGDVYKIEYHENCYDVILLEQSLHHFSPIEDLLVRLNRFLKQNGYLIINEFVGPARFQWTDRQLEAINGLLSALPAGYRTMWNSNSVKRKICKPSRLRMILDDPSEAVESANILPMMHKIFHVIEIKEYGGTILHMLFQGIAHNFLSEDRETRRLLDACFEVEDALLNNGDIRSDFIVAVCTKRND